MNQPKKQTTTANVKIEDGRLTLYLEVPLKWILVILISLLIYLLPEFWQTIQIAVSVIP